MPVKNAESSFCTTDFAFFGRQSLLLVAHVALQWLPPASSAIAHHVRFPLEGSPPGPLRLVRGLPTLPGGVSLPRLLPVLRRHLPLGRKAISRFVTMVRSSNRRRA